MSRFRAVLWDVDGTLLDFVYSQRHAVVKCFQEIGRDVTEEMLERYREINDGYWKRLELGEVTKSQLLSGRFADLFAEYGITEVDAEAFSGRYQTALGNIYRYMENAREVCESLRGKVRQYVITNGVTATQESKLKLSGLYELMDGVFISEQIGTPKPQAAFFDYCMNAIKESEGAVDKRTLLIVGDSLTSDIKGGVLYGIPVCWYRPERILETHPELLGDYEKYRPDYEISRLEDVYQILGI
ncbi:MAG: YjjG family noncanonical pyrimidine nucleotidase [Muribaculum sp.]|nr:YjjG family noncanonical pyrimidine nucleotidase [Muribaculum sp.]